MKIPDKGLWKGDWLPKTKVTTRDVKTAKDTDNEEEVSFGGGGIKLTPIEPMRKWRLEFEGNLRSLVSIIIIMKKRLLEQKSGPKFWLTFDIDAMNIFITKDGKVKRVRLDLLWRSDEAIFNYDCDMSSFAAAKAFAKESWSRQFFQDLEKAHQTHYEQMGRIDGKVTFFDDHPVEETPRNNTAQLQENIPISMPSFRDHSFGMKNYHITIIRVSFIFTISTRFITYISKP